LSETNNATPVDWNIVILGAWNVAILTPSRIASRLFGLEPGTPIEILVDTEGRAPIRVKYDDIIIEPSPVRLAITPQTPNFESLGRCIAIAQKALSILPETPFSAIGLNLRFKLDVIPDALIEAGESIIDNKLSDEGYILQDKELKRTIEWKDGVLNLNIQENKDSSALIGLNYHKNSSSPTELSDWLNYHQDMNDAADKIMGILINQ
jgi:hypothetical protein